MNRLLRLCAACFLSVAGCGSEALESTDAAVPTLDALALPDASTLPPDDSATPLDVGSYDASSADATLPDAGSDWVLRWSDEFDGPDGTSPDGTRWVFETGAGGWGNGELQNYTARTDNAVVQNGRLVITTRKESYQGSAYTSARLKTAGKFAFTYGRVEMSAVLPKGAGIWPAFWMLGANINQGVPWPDCGELDIMEFVGKTPTRVYGTLHGPGYSGGNGIGAWHEVPGGFSGGLHQYAVEWDPGAIRWYVDGILYQERTDSNGGADIGAGKKWVFDHDYFLLLNVAVGGNFPGPPDNTTQFPQTYSVDYVRVYQRSGPLPTVRKRNIVSLKARINGKFVSADKNNRDLLTASRASASGWELFELVDVGGGRVALWALSGDKFASGGVGGGNPLSATVETTGISEIFDLVTNGNGSTSFRSVANGRFITAPNNGASPLQATAAAITVAEEFDLGPR